MDFQHKIEHLKDKGQFRELKEVTSLEGKFIDIQKRRFVNFTSNDYLGIAQTPIDFERLNKDLHTYVDTPTAKAVGFFSAKPYASISSLYLPKAKGMPIPHPSSEHIVN